MAFEPLFRNIAQTTDKSMGAFSAPVDTRDVLQDGSVFQVLLYPNKTSLKTKALLCRCYLPAMKSFSITVNGAVPSGAVMNTSFIKPIVHPLPAGITATAQRPGSITGEFTSVCCFQNQNV